MMKEMVTFATSRVMQRVIWAPALLLLQHLCFLHFAQGCVSAVKKMTG